ncbi:MAG TPA: VWA domain-containing protein, partial [Deltaproteobacteria bacterium]|nr:VWA domain-containing protein [Deltaproteobacteria bacterium]
MGCKKCEGQGGEHEEPNRASMFPEYYKRFKYVEDTIIKLVAELLDDNLQAQDKTQEVLDSTDPAEMNMYHLNVDELDFLEVEQMRRAVSQLARKLSSRYSLRYKRAKHGGVDLRGTIQRAFVSTGGVPVELKRRKRIISRPEIVLLCDVSESVAAFSHFMLQLVYAIQFRFSYVRSFLFVDLIDEITP